jgi:hypothetical protein
MSTRRVVLGLQNDSTIGLRVSAVGVDAFVGDGSGGDFTFNSSWTDIAKIHMVGVASRGTITTVGGTSTTGFQTTWPALGYKPFVEARLLQSNVVYDDWMNSTFPSGSYAEIRNADPNSLYVPAINSAVGDSLLYIVYAIAVPSG